ncbi:NAD(P)H-dependent oxidoreductase [Verticiella alkaliphila]|uniref:NAD(P)H-dependent oxidoreductase n=1 Tax=Verticiella alkaliphila TaxID=2779529 RepID=UPI0035301126
MSSTDAVTDALNPRPTVLALAGSPSQQSRSSTLLAHAVARARDLGFQVEEIGLRNLPAEDLVNGAYTGDAARSLRDRVARASALLVATPVYKASFSGGLKTVLDLLAERSLTGKVVLPLATGGSPAHLLALEYSL